MNDSKVLGVSVRAWIAIITVLTVCTMQVCGLQVDEPLYSLVLMASGFYLGQKTHEKAVQ